MIEVQEMSNGEIEEILARVRYGHLGCSRDDRPYIVPVYYGYEKPYIYIYTTEGLKTEVINTNPNVCLQVEEVIDNEDWRSVVINGKAEQIIDQKEREKAVKLIRATNPTLTPAISIRWMDNWVRENIEVIYRVIPDSITGRSSVKVRMRAVFAQPANEQRSQLL